MNNFQTIFSPKRVKCAVCMVRARHGEYPYLWTSVESIATPIDRVSSRLLNWFNPQKGDAGVHDGITREECGHIKALERNVKKLRFTIETVKLIGVFFPTTQELKDLVGKKRNTCRVEQICTML